MFELSLAHPAKPKSVLILGAHCDDIEIGCGGTILRLVEHCPDAEIFWVTLSSDEGRERETRLAAAQLLAGARRTTVVVKSFRGSFFPYVGAEIKQFFEELKETLRPDVILTHCRHDLHQDHRVANELTWNTFRDQLILEYEVPKYDGDLGAPNAFISLSRAQVGRKVEVLLDCFPSQRRKPWFTRETFEAIARLRGIESNAPDGYAEAFYCRKAVLRF
jgi:LmbE family N-acetylglucosaminyl deacetylase